MKIGFIGGGKMAEALLSGLLSQHVVNQDDICLSDRDECRCEWIAGKYGVSTRSRNRDVVTASDCIILAVKPQDLDLVLEALEDVSQSRLFVSIAAGRRLDYFQSRLSGARIVRVMPNLACQVGEGMSVYCRGKDATDVDADWVKRMLESCGKAIELDESRFDQVTALSGSGPAFYAFFAKAMIDRSVECGMDAQTAELLALQTMRGAATVMLQNNISCADLMKNVASKGGTTAAGFSVLENSDVSQVVCDTLDAAAQRSAALSS